MAIEQAFEVCVGKHRVSVSVHNRDSVIVGCNTAGVFASIEEVEAFARALLGAAEMARRIEASIASLREAIESGDASNRHS